MGHCRVWRCEYHIDCLFPLGERIEKLNVAHKYQSRVDTRLYGRTQIGDSGRVFRSVHRVS